MTIEAIEVEKTDEAELTVTMKGSAHHIIQVLVKGLPTADLEAIREALKQELEAR